MSKIKIIKIIICIITILIFGINIFIIITSDINAETIIKSKIGFENPTFTLGQSLIKVIKVDQSNAIKNTFNSKYIALIKRNNIIGGYQYTMERTFPFSAFKITNEKSFTYFGSESYDMIASKISDFDWFDKNKSNLYENESTISGEFNEIDDYFNPKKNLEHSNVAGLLIKDYYKLTNKMILSKFFKFNFRGDIITSGPVTKHTKTELIIVLEDPLFKNINFACIAFDNGFSDETAESSYITNLYFVKKDRTIIEVPVKSDNSFDIDSIIEKLK